MHSFNTHFIFWVPHHQMAGIPMRLIHSAQLCLLRWARGTTATPGLWSREATGLSPSRALWSATPAGSSEAGLLELLSSRWDKSKSIQKGHFLERQRKPLFSWLQFTYITQMCWISYVANVSVPLICTNFSEMLNSITLAKPTLRKKQ